MLHIIKALISKMAIFHRLQFDLFGFLNNLALWHAKNPLIHSFSYESTGFFTIPLASLPRNPKSFMNYPGQAEKYCRSIFNALPPIEFNLLFLREPKFCYKETSA